MTRDAMIARLGQMIEELKRLEAHLDHTPGHSLCVAAGLMLRTLVETLAEQEGGGREAPGG